MAKVTKFSDKIKKLKRTAEVTFYTDDPNENITFNVQSVSQNVMDAIDAKYEAKKPKVPSRRVPVGNGKGAKVVEFPNDPDYQSKLSDVLRDKMAEMAINFLVDEDKPEGTIEEQIKEIQDVELAGFVGKIVNRGLEISGLIDEDVEEEIEEAKND